MQAAREPEGGPHLEDYCRSVSSLNGVCLPDVVHLALFRSLRANDLCEAVACCE